MITFTLNDVHKMTNERAYARGQEYYERGRVLSASYDEESGIYYGSVKGSTRHIYRVELAVESGRLVGLCSCPVSLNCKHAVATALTLYREAHPEPLAAPEGNGKQHSTPQPPAEAPWQRWLAELPATPRPETDALEHGRHYLVYFLDPDTHSSPPRLRLAMKKGYLKKDGQWSQLRFFQPDTANLGWNRPNHLLDADVEILQLLPRSGANRQQELRGESGHRALVHLLNCGRFFYDDELIHKGPARTLSWHWKHLDNNQQKLVGELGGIKLVGDSPGWLPIPVTPPCYLDLENCTIGDIHTPVPSIQLPHLLAMPPVADRDITRMAVQLRQHVAREQLPLPVEPKITRVTEFTPLLTLLTVDLGKHRLPALKLEFEYAGFPLPAPYSHAFSGSEESREREGHYYQINRDLDTERSHCDEIHELGFYLMQEKLGDQQEIWLQRARHPTEIPQQWNHFLSQDLPELQKHGWKVVTDSSYRFGVRKGSFSVTVADARNHWFELGLDLNLDDGTKVQTAALLEHWLESGTPEQLTLNLHGDWVEVDTRPLQGIRSLLAELLSEKKLDKPMLMPPFQAAQIADIPELDQRKAPLTKALMQRLQDFTGLKSVPAPTGLNAQLRGYQQEGLNWLVFLQQYGFGGILADDMGLGKTLQTLALIQHMKESGTLKKPALVVAPTSLTGNWVHEAAQFAPDLKVTLIHGPDRDATFAHIRDSDLVITTYPLLLRDKAHYDKRKFSLMVLDEAQAIKNPGAKVSECVREIESESRLCLTGTPLENHLGELWSLMDFALPGLLGGRKTFSRMYRNAIENHGDEERQQELARKVRPFMLRRTKNEVVKELPPKTESVVHVELGEGQRALYESVRASMEQRIRDLIEHQGMAKSHIEFLDALLKLRQTCIDPRLLKLGKAREFGESAKFDWLAETLPQLLEEGRSILIFSQFTQVLKLIEDQLNEQGIAFSKLTGQTRKRQDAIDRFQNGDVPVFLISLKAGGAGLNLTAADVVIHMDPWWNPAVERQATDRAYRIGQDKPVFVYKLVAENTVEERIHDMQQQKQMLADTLFDATKSGKLPDSSEDLLALLS